MVGDSRGRLTAFQNTMFTTAFASDANGLQLSSLLPELDKDDLSPSSSGPHRLMESAYSVDSRNVEIGNQAVLPSGIGNCLQPDDVNATAISQFTVDLDVPYMYSDLDIQQNALCEFVIADMMEAIEDIWNFPVQEDRYFDAGSQVLSGETCNYLTPEKMLRVPEDEIGDEANHLDVGGFGGLPKDHELKDVFGAAFLAENDTHSWSSDEANVYAVEDLGPLVTESSVWSLEGHQDHLLDAVVTSLCNNSDETISYWCNSSRSSITSFAEIGPSFQVPTSYEAMAATAQEAANVLGEFTTLSGDPTACVKSLTPPSSFESFTSGVSEYKQAVESPPELADENADFPRVSGKSKPKSGHRPRPRDRQLIQERLKELRELVPNGDKSSIDGLLDQTIKHMLFLKGVTEQAEKVKQFTDQKLLVNENRETSSGRTSDTSSVVKVEDKSGSCPIIVKDLEHPGDILIQMLCNNEEVFFEMAQVMHQLKLTILRGVMETHSEKWAHFVVQASNGFNRLDIFWPLMRILQRNGSWSLN